MLNADSTHRKSTAEGQEGRVVVAETREPSGENTHMGKYSNSRYLQRIATNDKQSNVTASIIRSCVRVIDSPLVILSRVCFQILG